MIRSRSRVPWLPLACMLLVLASARPSGAADSSTWTRDDAAHLLRRAGFGGTPTQIDSLHALGRVQAVEYLLTGKLEDNVQPVFTPITFPDFETTPVDKTIKPDTDKKQLQKMVQQKGRQDLQHYRAYWVDRMLKTDRPLEEKMTL